MRVHGSQSIRCARWWWRDVDGFCGGGRATRARSRARISAYVRGPPTKTSCIKYWKRNLFSRSSVRVFASDLVHMSSMRAAAVAAAAAAALCSIYAGYICTCRVSRRDKLLLCVRVLCVHMCFMCAAACVVVRLYTRVHQPQLKWVRVCLCVHKTFIHFHVINERLYCLQHPNRTHTRAYARVEMGTHSTTFWPCDRHTHTQRNGVCIRQHSVHWAYSHACKSLIFRCH